MSTPCLVHFSSGRIFRPGKAEISVYVHWDGYPDGAEGMSSTLDLFVYHLEAYSGRRQVFNSLPSEMASKFIVFLAKKYTTKAGTNYLDFASPYVVDWQEYYADYEYYFDCRTLQFHWRRNV